MKTVRDACKPRPEVLKSDLQDAIFAADFGFVIDNSAPKVYRDAQLFFRNTHPAAPLKKIVGTVFGRLTDPNESGAVIRLSTGFGGGKTHTLIALWHLAQNIADVTLGTELLPAAGRPAKVAVAGMDGGKYGSEVCGTHDGLETHALWTELAYQLGGQKVFEQLKPYDDPENMPNAAKLRSILPDGPVLILLDELVTYMGALKRGDDALLSFLNMLMGEIGARPQAVLVVTDPAGQAAYQSLSAQLTATVLQHAQRLDDVIGRKSSDFDPIGNEAAQVIVRRLFERVDGAAANEASAEYHETYKRVAQDYPDMLPAEATTLQYAERIRQCYPFHPHLLETAQNRLGALQDFQKSRGTLRLFARILRDHIDSHADLSLITAGDVAWTSERIQADLLQRLNRDAFKPAADVDVVKHAGDLDTTYSTDAHRRVASALLLESLPMTDAAAMDKRELTLAVLRPSDVGNEPGEAIDRLLSVCWHIYKTDSGHAYRFRYEPNVNRLIEERAKAPGRAEDARAEVLALAHNYFRGHTFTLVAYPGSPNAVSDSASLKLVLSDSEALAQRVCNYEDDTDPAAVRPRRFRNAILGIAPSPTALNEAVEAMCSRLAAEEIEKQEKKKSPLKDQVLEKLPGLTKRARFRTLRAFNRVVFQGRQSVTLEEKYLVPEDGALDSSFSGQSQLRKLLDDKGYIYQPNDALDVDLLINAIMPGATPSVEYLGAYPVSAVQERALSHDKVRLMLDGSPVRNAILKGVGEGKLVLRLPNGEVYDKDGCVVGPAGARKRTGKKLFTLPLNHDVLLAPAGAACVPPWTQVDAEKPADVLTIGEAAAQKLTTFAAIQQAIATGELDATTGDGHTYVLVNEKCAQWQPAAPDEAVAVTWEEAIQYAAKRPLRSLKLKATTPDVAKTLITLAPPFGAKALTVTAKVKGGLKDGGQVNYQVSEVKHNNPLKPIEMASTIFKSMNEGGQFTAELTLSFDDSLLADAGPKLEQACSIAATGVKVEAEFGAEVT